LTLRLSAGEREQIAAAAELQDMPLRSYLRCAALQHSAVAVAKANVGPVNYEDFDLFATRVETLTDAGSP
jgi:uncharacterized protein (DUF1778 family)